MAESSDIIRKWSGHRGDDGSSINSPHPWACLVSPLSALSHPRQFIKLVVSFTGQSQREQTTERPDEWSTSPSYGNNLLSPASPRSLPIRSTLDHLDAPSSCNPLRVNKSCCGQCQTRRSTNPHPLTVRHCCTAHIRPRQRSVSFQRVQDA